MQVFRVLFLLSSLVYSTLSIALVDYSTDQDGFVPKSARKRPQGKMIKKARPNVAKASSGKSITKTFDVNSLFQSNSVRINDRDVKSQMVIFNGHFETFYNIFADFSYWSAKVDDKDISPSSSYQSGNPEFILGFNWLQFGSNEEATSLDILAGAKFASKSLLASSRDDKIVGLSTAKRFHDFALLLSYKLYLTGTPDKASEMDIGNINKITATVGWMVSNDIQFEVEAGTVAISKSGDDKRENALSEDVGFGHVAPALNLGISPFMNIKMGAVFRTKRLRSKQDLTKARLWDLKGAYGNSLFAGFNLSM